MRVILSGAKDRLGHAIGRQSFRSTPLIGILVRLLPFLLSVAAAAPLAAQAGSSPASPATRTARALDANILRAHLEFLADDALEGRAPGTRGGATAAKYIAAQFARLGLEPAGDSGTWFQRVPIIALTPEPALAMTGATPAPLAWKSDYVLWSMRNDSLVDVTGDAVFVGYGIVAPEEGWNDYAGLDVKGKFVVALVNDPGLRDSTIFRGRILTYYGRWTYKLEEARRQGAAGILLVHTTESATYPWTTVLSGWVGPQVRLETPPSPPRWPDGFTRTRPPDCSSRVGRTSRPCRTQRRGQASRRYRSASSFRAPCGASSGGRRPRTSSDAGRGADRSPARRC